MVIFTLQDFVSTIQILRPAYYHNQTIIISIELNQEYEDHHIIWGTLDYISKLNWLVFLRLSLKDIEMMIDIRR